MKSTDKATAPADQIEDNIDSDDELFEENVEGFDDELDSGDPSDKIPAAGEAQNLQNQYLNILRKEKVPLLVYLVNGVKLQGMVESFDQYVVLLRNTSSQMIYKHAISTIVPIQRGAYPERYDPRSGPDPRGGGYGGYQGGQGGQGGRRLRRQRLWRWPQVPPSPRWSASPRRLPQPPLASRRLRRRKRRLALLAAAIICFWRQIAPHALGAAAGSCRCLLLLRLWRGGSPFERQRP